jgi:putative membrane-bound dehydrogenase-like protein
MLRSVLSLALLLGCSVLPAIGQAPSKRVDAGVLPKGADGHTLNLDFETGTLKDWTATGDAFAGQPVEGDTVHPRRSDMKSQHQGRFWIGTYEKKGDKPQGTLSSEAFVITHPWASFMISGGTDMATCVELVRKDTGNVFFRASGLEDEGLTRIPVDLRQLQGKEMFIRLVDRNSGGWGHINFDDFRFHTAKPDLAERRPIQSPGAPDKLKYAGLPPKEAAEAMTVPPGFTVQLFAGEPDIRQPIAFCMDERGRLWVAEAYSYPLRRPEKDAHDRILIFEDTNGDGVFDKKTVFLDNLNLVSGLEVGHGGVWIGAAPNFLFVPVKPGEDKPAGPPQVLLDGWGYQDTHETLNTFTWGPDGWLYGCHGVFTHSRVGKPGTPDAQRTKINAGIWRYHPVKHTFEVFAEGTSNPWGIDFDDHGQAFIEACVIPHSFHMIQNGRFQRQAGSHFNPYTYADIVTIADHRHYMGATPHGGNNRSDKTGGGHAHCGLMIYLGDAWPKEYRGQMMMGNIHGHRLNTDLLHPAGSGFVASHGNDFLLANDSWARFINFRYGPDGNVYLLDWYDKQACHTSQEAIWDRTNGRIYKISYQGAKPVTVDLRQKTDLELVELQLHPNDWYVRQARLLLAERGGNAAVHEALAKIAFTNSDETRRLRGLWALHVTGGLTEERVQQGLADAGPYVRAWTIQLALENGTASPALLSKLADMAKADSSPVVRLYLAAGAIRLPVAERWNIVEGLLTHTEDAKDHNLPLMYWYAAEPLGGLDAARALELAQAHLGLPILPFMVRRIAAAGTPEAVELLVSHMARANEPDVQMMFLEGLRDSLQGRRQVKMPAAWREVYAHLMKSAQSEIRDQADALAVTFGDSRAFAQLRQLALSHSGDPLRRKNALTALLAARDSELAPVLQQLVGDAGVREQALRGLASYSDPKTPAAILAVYADLAPAEKRDALATLASRPSYGKALLDALSAKQIDGKDISADVVRQLRTLRNKDLDKRIAEVWGVVRATAADRLKQQSTYKKMLLSIPETQADVALGRTVYAKTCANCHALFGAGGKIGPDLTGSNRANIDYLLENMLDPSAVIPKEYAVTLFELNSGRFVTGILKEETPDAFKVVTATENLTIPRNEVVARQPTQQSMMPEDQLKPMSEHEVRSLVAYLQSPSQVPLMVTPETAKEFFNGKDLTGWTGTPGLWSVENGEIVGKTAKGLKKNTFLTSQVQAEDFKLSLKIKLVPNKENSGIQFRSVPLPDGEMRGPQADVGQGWWGKLYEESARGLLWKQSGESHVKVADWNLYEVEANGPHVRTWINGHLCVDLKDDFLSRRGVFGLQMHAGGPLEVRFKDIQLTVLNPPTEKKQAKAP